MNKYIMLCDTETVNKNSGFSMYGNLIFDFGAIIIEKETWKIIYRYNVLIDEIYNDKELMGNYCFGQERLNQFYKTDNKIAIKTFNQFYNELENLILAYNIKELYAYNINFDVRALKDTAAKFKKPSLVAKYNIDIFDLYHAAASVINQRYLEDYIMYCIEYGRISDKGNVSSNAEAMYCYIKKQPDFIESHTALDDTLIELEILKFIKNEEKEGLKVKYTPNTAAWRLVQTPKKKGK